jgi:hypothetical protein
VDAAAKHESQVAPSGFFDGVPAPRKSIRSPGLDLPNYNLIAMSAQLPHDDLPASLNYAPPPTSRADRLKNISLAGTGFNPILVYASALGLVFFWVFGAYALSLFGPIFALLLTAGIIGSASHFTRRQSIRSARASAGFCAKCGYDLRASFERCPECGDPIPEDLQRRRRLLALARPADHAVAVKPPAPSNAAQAPGRQP